MYLISAFADVIDFLVESSFKTTTLSLPRKVVTRDLRPKLSNAEQFIIESPQGDTDSQTPEDGRDTCKSNLSSRYQNLQIFVAVKNARHLAQASNGAATILHWPTKPCTKLLLSFGKMIYPQISLRKDVQSWLRRWPRSIKITSPIRVSSMIDTYLVHIAPQTPKSGVFYFYSSATKKLFHHNFVSRQSLPKTLLDLNGSYLWEPIRCSPGEKKKKWYHKVFCKSKKDCKQLYIDNTPVAVTRPLFDS